MECKKTEDQVMLEKHHDDKSRKNPNLREDYTRFYHCIDKLHDKFGEITFKDIKGKDLPEKGVYFIFEPAEFRYKTKKLRVVRVGTHQVQKKSHATLKDRLVKHTRSHKTSAFRRLLGVSLASEASYDKTLIEDWYRDHKLDLVTEKNIKELVSEHIDKMSILYVKILDDSSKYSDRAYIESNSIGLLSQANKKKIDKPTKEWLGSVLGSKDEVRESRLWIVKDYRYPYESKFLDVFERYVRGTLGDEPDPQEPLAPKGWKEKS